MTKSLLLTFWLLIAAFFFILLEMLVPLVRNIFKGSILFLLPFLIFCLLGLVLIFLTYKAELDKRFKKFLILTGISAASILVSIFLHNIFYALGTVMDQITLLKYLFEFLHAAFFILALFVCPVGFLVGVSGTLVLFFRKNNK